MNSSSRSFSILAIFMLFSTIFQPCATCHEIDGTVFPDQIIIDNSVCYLNGAGLREKFFFNVFSGALYLQRMTDSAEEVITSEQIKRIIINFRYKEVTIERLLKNSHEGFGFNSPWAYDTCPEKISRFNACFTEPMHRGDELVLTYIPGVGTEIMIKNEVRDTIPGRDFMQAVAGHWFGPKPPSKSFKRALLRGAPDSADSSMVTER